MLYSSVLVLVAVIAGLIFFEMIPVARAEDMCNLINIYREMSGQRPLTRSYALDFVAEVHRRDLDDLVPVYPCDHHSWQNNLPHYSGCCFDDAKMDAQCMWGKPAELTTYKDAGFEISSYGCSTPKCAVDAWRNSAPHNAAMLHPAFASIGCSYKFTGGHAVVWFGRTNDTSGWDKYAPYPPLPGEKPTAPPTLSPIHSLVPATPMPTLEPTPQPTPAATSDLLWLLFEYFALRFPTDTPTYSPTPVPVVVPSRVPTHSPTLGALPTFSPVPLPTTNTITATPKSRVPTSVSTVPTIRTSVPPVLPEPSSHTSSNSKTNTADVIGTSTVSSLAPIYLIRTLTPAAANSNHTGIFTTTSTTSAPRGPEPYQEPTSTLVTVVDGFSAEKIAALVIFIIILAIFVSIVICVWVFYCRKGPVANPNNNDNGGVERRRRHSSRHLGENSRNNSRSNSRNVARGASRNVSRNRRVSRR